MANQHDHIHLQYKYRISQIPRFKIILLVAIITVSCDLRYDSYKLMATYILYFFFIHIALLIIGFGIVHATRLFQDRPSVKIIMAYLVSMVFTALVGFIFYVLKVPDIVVQVAFWLVFATSLFAVFYFKLYLEILRQWIPIAAFIVMSGFTLCFTFLNTSGSQPIIPDPEQRGDRNYSTLNVKVLNIAQTNANDNYIPYRQAQFFVNRSNPATDSFIEEWGVHFFQRTPLMGAVTAGYFLALNDKPPVDYTWSNAADDKDGTYGKFQVIAQILNCLFIIPAFYLTRKIFNRKAALLTLLFLIPSQFFLYNAFFSWPKSLVAFFIVASWYFIVVDKRFRYVAVAAVASGLAYLTHDLAVLYIGASFIFLLINKRIRDAFIVGVGSALFALPWLFLSSVVFHRPSSFIYYPISTVDIPQPGRIKETIDTFLHTSPLRLIMIRVESIFYLLAPYQLVIPEAAQGIMRKIWAVGIYSVPGALGFGLVIPAILGFFKKNKIIGLSILIFGPIVLCALIIGWPRGMGALHFAQAVVVLLTGLAAFTLAGLKKFIWTYVAMAVNLIQLVCMMMFSYNFTLNIFDVQNFALLFVMAVVVTGTFVAAHYVNKYLPANSK